LIFGLVSENEIKLLGFSMEGAFIILEKTPNIFFLSLPVNVVKN
jgi:hypothetical protein